jgi:hypothetical protein
LSNGLQSRAEEFLRLGRRDNERPGMVWLLAISVPDAFHHAGSRRDRRHADCQGRLEENDGGAAFLPSAM